jgi:Ca2+-binding RTX toxin-like protein
MSQPWKSTPVMLNAGLGLDTLKGPHIANSWQVLAADAGKLNDGISFFGMENLSGGKDTDKFLLKAGTTISGAIGGGLGTDVLDYSPYGTSATVDLPNGTATGVGALKIGTIENVVGTVFDDLILGDFNPNELNGNGGNDVLIGNAGKDKLFGESGRDLLFAGLGSDELNGGLEDDLLIHGATQWDADTTALNAIRDEWTRMDADYDHRITHLRNGGGNNGAYVLVANTTVFDDGVADILTGEDGQDWFWAAYPGIDVIVDLKGDEVVN